jgi:hypothetical protein
LTSLFFLLEAEATMMSDSDEDILDDTAMQPEPMDEEITPYIVSRFMQTVTSHLLV